MPFSAAPPSQPLWLWPNLLSLDAPLIAVLWLHLAADCLGSYVAPQVSLVLVLAVWLIYAADRLFDGMRADPLAPLAPRHRFYRAHREVFVPLLAAVFGLTCWACLQLDFRTFLGGALLMLVVCAYLAAVHCMKSVWRYRLPKEVAVAAVFGAGTFFPIWIQAHGSTTGASVSLVFFILICWLNVVLIECTEWATLRQTAAEMPHPWTMSAGKHLPALAMLLAAGALSLAHATIVRPETPLLLAIAISALALAALAYSWRKLSLNAVRALADAALLTPALILLFLHR